jgi:DNA-binding MarR family transcriptional regulator
MLKDIADELKLTPGAISQTVDILVRENIVERTVSPTDRRAILLRPTAQGLILKDEHYKNGMLGYFEGRELIVIPQVFEKGKVGQYKIDNTLIWIMPASEERFIKLVNEGDTQLRAITDKDTNMDMTYEQEIQTKLGVAIMLNSCFGVYDIDA